MDVLDNNARATRDALEMHQGQPAQNRYEQMLASSATAAICAGSDGLIISWNTAAEELFGHSAQAAIGQELSIIIPARHRDAHVAGLSRAVQDGKARLAGTSVDILALHADGSEVPVELSLSMWFEEGRPMFGALLRDITDRHNSRRHLEHLAHCDTLTSLPNRNALHERLSKDVGAAACSLLLLDLDGFKHVNDSLGHSVGDQLLSRVATRLVAAVAETGFVARLGGDEFAVMLPECVDPLAINAVTTRIFEVLQAPFDVAGQSIFVDTSIGIAMAPKDASCVDKLLSCADLALYSAKGQGGGVRTFFARAMQNTSEQRQRLGTELRLALANGEFELLYQPQIALTDSSLAGVEALLRWHHPQHGMLLPHSFIGVLEDSPIAEEVGDWIVDQACAAAAKWAKVGLADLRVGVNLFSAQLRSGRLCNVVTSALNRHGISADRLELEITENTVLRHNNQSTNALKKLRSLGVGIALDDFGTGYASLSLLQNFPLTRLKIDKGFVARIDRKAGDAAIVRAVIGMATGLGLSVIAEGVETVGQEAALVQLGCEEAQGFRYGRPMTETTITANFAHRGGSPHSSTRRYCSRRN